jgi:signal peptidase II
MHKELKNKKIYTLSIVLLIFFDQVTKLYFMDLVHPLYGGVEVNAVFNLVHVWNKGVSFGMFSSFEYSNFLFLGLSMLITLALIFLLFKEDSALYSVSYSLIIGGAIGNMLDRARFGGVFDFIDFHISNYHWPAFNMADSFICVGAFIFLYCSLCTKNQEKSL